MYSLVKVFVHFTRIDSLELWQMPDFDHLFLLLFSWAKLHVYLITCLKASSLKCVYEYKPILVLIY